jgi:hypothetical protein
MVIDDYANKVGINIEDAEYKAGFVMARVLERTEADESIIKWNTRAGDLFLQVSTGSLDEEVDRCTDPVMENKMKFASGTSTNTLSS